MAMTAQEIINSLNSKQSEEEYEEEDFEAVELRITVAQHYRLLLRDSLFDDNGPAAQQVEDEIREFVKSRIRILLGMEQPQINVVERDPVFSADQIVALKELADKLLDTSDRPVLEPVVAATATEPTKTVKTSIVESKKKPGPKVGSKRPGLRKRDVPEELRLGAVPQRPPPTAKPDSAKSTPVVTGTGNDAMIELPPNPKTGARRVAKNNKILEQRLDDEGSIIENEHGGEMWADITPQARPPPGSNFIPMPASNQLEAIGMQEALANQTRVTQGGLSDVIAFALK